MSNLKAGTIEVVAQCSQPPPRGAEGADAATVKDAVAEASKNARQAGYTPSGIARIISTPSDVSMFSRLPEADQKAVLRQADDAEFSSATSRTRK